MCMLCEEEAFYRAYLEHKAKLEADAQRRALAAVETVAPAPAGPRADEPKTSE